ncbi:MAG: hypothetical protein LQ337_001574 [Flavoplaca oasis]|nr:MAG: hypothetical protein LQ337_001574 [Flavoplaca oasis]
MSLIDTKSMESVGVRERSTGTYDVHGVPAAISAHNRSNLHGQSQISGKCGSDLALQRSASTSEVKTEEGSVNGMKGPLDKLPQNEPLQPSDVKPAQAEGQKTSVTAFRHLQNEEAANVEKWRQDVETPDETQAKIDAVIAANEMTPDDPNSNPKDENPRADRARAGLIPGKKVYCSHWIRSGDCDFVQQGCLFKHEMPDDATLRAIGIRALPSWYIAAHPEKARKRGWGSGKKDAETSGRESAIKVEGEATKHSLSGVSTHDKEPRLSNVQAATSLPSLRVDKDHTAILKALTSHPVGKSNGFAPLVPSAAPESVPLDLSAREGQTNIPSTPFDQAPGQQKAPRQMFRRSAREGRALGSKSLEQSNQASAVFKQEDKEVAQKEAIASREHCHVRADKIFGRKDLKEDNKKKLSCSPEGKPKAKRAVKGRAPSVEPLLDFED